VRQKIIFQCWFECFCIMVYDFNIRWKSTVLLGSCIVHSFLVTSEVSFWQFKVMVMSYTVYFLICLKFFLCCQQQKA
jgi:hypothetical protein